jgi:osmoprotectant transport system substrate-binding protein
MYAQLLAKAGYSTHITQVANRELYEPALEKGQISVVPEYAATMAEFLNDKVNGANAKPVASPDLNTTMAALNRLAGPLGLKALPAGKAVDQNAFAVSKTFAAQHHLTTLSDLGKSGAAVKVAAGDECKTRPFCIPGLEKTYGIKVSGLDPKGVDTPQSKQAVKNGQDQLVLVTTTDATLGQFGLVALQDDKHLQNADYVLPMVNARTAGGAKVAAALNPLSSVLTTADLAALDQQVDGQRQQPQAVAQAYLKSKGLL